jgi:peptide/nickel transport system substrate-binding protein
VGYNINKPPFNDLRVRQAANFGIDREGMANALGFGIAKPHYYPYYNSGTIGFDPNVEIYKYNPTKVKELLTAAGYPNGISFELKVIAREPESTISEYVQQMWAAVGINVKLNKLARAAWGQILTTGDFQATFWRGQLWASVDPEFARPLIGKGGASNWSFFSDPVIDKALDQGLQTLDPKKRAGVYSAMWRRIHQAAYISGGYLVPTIIATRKEVQGLAFDWQPIDFRRIWIG